MRTCQRLLILFTLPLSLLSACKEKAEVSEAGTNAPVKAAEHIDADEKAAGAKLKMIQDPVREKIQAFRVKVRNDFNAKQWENLDATAAELRASKELFRNGSWKIVQFYTAFEIGDDKPDSVWKEHESAYQEWIAAKPLSITARVAYAHFLTDYAWEARGSGFADTITEEGGKLFEKRLAAAFKVLEDARELPEKDPDWWRAALTVALGQGWPKAEYDALVRNAVEFEPKFWGYDNARALSLLPRWYGEEGDWEAYADEAARRPEGLGDEVYARIVMGLYEYYDHVFSETKASWPKTRAGLEQIRKKYPESLELVSQTAMLAGIAGDRTTAQEMFTQLGDTCIQSVWRKPERFVHVRNWARTGKW